MRLLVPVNVVNDLDPPLGFEAGLLAAVEFGPLDPLEQDLGSDGSFLEQWSGLALVAVKSHVDTQGFEIGCFVCPVIESALDDQDVESGALNWGTSV